MKRIVIVIIGLYIISFAAVRDDLNPQNVELEGVYYRGDELIEIYKDGHFLLKSNKAEDDGTWSYSSFRLYLDSGRSFRVIRYDSTLRLLEVERGEDPDLWDFDDSFKLSFWLRSLPGRMYSAIKKSNKKIKQRKKDRTSETKGEIGDM